MKYCKLSEVPNILLSSTSDTASNWPFSIQQRHIYEVTT